MRQVRLTRAAPGMAIVTAVAALIAGCGSQADYANNPRPAAPIVITAAIVANHVVVSPSAFGAGPIELVVTNQTGASQQLTIETDQTLGGSAPGLRQQTGPINPQGTATLKADVTEGSYVVRVETSAIKPASIQVQGKRPSAQNQLLQP